MPDKRRILLVSEFSALASGYSNFTREVFTRLHASGKFELAELASYGAFNDSRSLDLPWKFYWAMPNPDSQTEIDEYGTHSHNEFGRARLEEALLDFKPDIVYSCRDWNVEFFVADSPFRRFFHWVFQTTCDSAPSPMEALALYGQADTLLTYSEFAKELIATETNGKIAPAFAAPPAADFECFVPVTNKSAHKKAVGLPEDSVIAMMVSRNQPRKLFGDFIEAFSLFVNNAHPSLAKRAYCYLHTTYPDRNPFDIPRLVRDSGISNKILFTYLCANCTQVFPGCWSDSVCICPYCASPTAKTTSVNEGISRQKLANVMQVADLGIQLSSCEGFGLAQVEFAYCGVPVASTDYSAMSTVVRQLEGFPINVAKYRREPELHRLLAVPDGNHLAQIMNSFFAKPEAVRRQFGNVAREAALRYFTYDKTAAKLEELFENVVLTGSQGRWNEPRKLLKHPTILPQNQTTPEFVKWGIETIAGLTKPNQYTVMTMLRDINNGCKQINMNTAPYSRDNFYQEMLRIHEKYNIWEKKRAENV